MSYKGYDQVLEIGPGTGVLTKHIIRKGIKVTALELDRESVAYMKQTFPIEHSKIVNESTFEVIEADFLKKNLKDIYGDGSFAIIGNFPTI